MDSLDNHNDMPLLSCFVLDGSCWNRIFTGFAWKPPGKSGLFRFWYMIKSVFYRFSELGKKIALNILTCHICVTVNDLPSSVKGLIEGVLSTIALVIFFAILPMVRNSFSRFVRIVLWTMRKLRGNLKHPIICQNTRRKSVIFILN